MNFSFRLTAEAISVMEIEEVLEAKIVSGLQIASSSWKTVHGAAAYNYDFFHDISISLSFRSDIGKAPCRWGGGTDSAVFEGGDLLLVQEGVHGVLLVLSGKAQAEGL